MLRLRSALNERALSPVQYMMNALLRLPYDFFVDFVDDTDLVEFVRELKLPKNQFLISIREQSEH